MSVNLEEKVLNILGLLSQSLKDNRDLVYDAREIWEELIAKGYTDSEIEHTLAHIEETSLQGPGPFWSETVPVYRSYTDMESTRLTVKARGFLWKLKSMGVIDHALEDEIVHKAMDLEGSAGVKEIKTVAALTIFGYEHRTYADEISPENLESKVI